MGKAHKYVAGTIVAATIATGAYLLNRDYSAQIPESHQTRQTIDDKVNSSPISTDYQKPSTNQVINQDNNSRTQTYNLESLEGLLKIGGQEMENRLYGALISEFHENLDGLNFYGSEEFFKGDFILEFKDTKSEDLIHAYEEKLKNLSESERQDLTTRYGEVINILRQNSSLSIEEIATKNGYLGAEETANRLWNSMSSNQLWGKSRLGETFADVINNDLLSPEKLDLFLRATRAYCESKSVEDKGITLIDNIRKYQSSMPEFNALDKKRNN
ncbi:MAG: hypothetical protein AABX94_05025, partial [Nanoarchaeota archaeon]